MLRSSKESNASARKIVARLTRLPRSVAWRFVLAIDAIFLKLAVRSRFFAGLYYALLNTGFSYEQLSFITGRKMYAEHLNDPDRSMALLRRNIHRIEKGLLMRPRRVPFAREFIGETVAGFCTAVAKDKLDCTELRWANDVLAEYFGVCSNTNSLTRHEKHFRFHQLDDQSDGSDALIPYKRREEDKPKISANDLLMLAKYRRSVRWFLPTRVPRKIIDMAIVVGGYSPSACNRQPYEFRVIDDPQLVAKISAIPMGTSGYSHNIPCFVVIVGRQRNYFHERDRHLIYIDGSLAAMSFIFALECQGVSTCCINWPEIARKDKAMASVLNLEPDERPVMCIAVGYPDPDGMVANSSKKSLSVIRRYNFE